MSSPPVQTTKIWDGSDRLRAGQQAVIHWIEQQGGDRSLGSTPGRAKDVTHVTFEQKHISFKFM